MIAAVASRATGTALDFVLVAGAEPVGRIAVRGDARRLEINLAVDNNGRGAKTTEVLELDERGLPLSWRITGTSLMGSVVNETFRRYAGIERWSSRGAEGQDAHDNDARLYVADDGSPYSIHIYALAALRAGGSIATVPFANELTVTAIDALDVRGPDGPLSATAYAVSGMQLTPELVVMSADGDLLAATSGELGLLLRTDLIDEARRIQEHLNHLTHQYLAELHVGLRHRHPGLVRIRHVRIFDPRSGGLSELSSVSFFRGVLTTIVSESDTEAPCDDDTVEYDGQGGTVLPGLHDMHAHLHPWGALLHLAAGVTTVRDMGNDNPTLLHLTELISGGDLPGPDVVRSGFIEGRSAYSARFGAIPETLEAALSQVRWYADHGYRQIKIYNSFHPEWVAPVAQEASRLGLPVVGHVPAFMSPDQAIEAGYREITHVNQLMLGWLLEPDEDTRTALRLTAMARASQLDLEAPQVRNTIDLMRRNQVGLDTTAVILERLMLSRTRTIIPADAPFLEHTPWAYQRRRRRAYVDADATVDDQRYRRAFDKVLELLGRLHDVGIALWPGTDDDTGFTMHRELELYVAAGIPPSEVLRRATLDCAAHLGRAHTHGTIERGRTATFLLVDGDPTQDISAVRRIRLVAKDGDVYFPEEIYPHLGIRPFASRPPRVTEGEVKK